MFNEQLFRNFLRKKKGSVIDRNVKTVNHFISFLNDNNISFDRISVDDINNYVVYLEGQ